jgi:hypothetical protein
MISSDLALEVLERAVGHLDLVALAELDLGRDLVGRLLAASISLASSFAVIGEGLPLEPMKSPTPSVSLIMNQTFSGSSRWSPVRAR